MMSEQEKTKEDEEYWKILEFLDKQVKEKKISAKRVLLFKRMIRNNKYVATYVKSMKKNLNGIENIEQYRQREEEARKDYTKWIHSNLSTILFLQSDPIKILHSFVENAIDREGKICDFNDSIQPDTKFGYCESDEHEEHGTSNEKQELKCILWVDDDTAKFDDEHPCYVCENCFETINGDCEVSCDME